MGQPTSDDLLATTGAVRECAAQLLGCLAKAKGNPVPCKEDVLAAIQRLLKQPYLFQAGQKRPSAHADAACMLYFDPGLMIAMAQSHEGQTETPHNHGVWLATGVYEGEVLYRGFERVDDRSRPGHADLRTVEDRVLRAGDVALAAPPPNDIHETVSLTQCTMMVVTGGNFAVLRDYFDVKEKRYATR